MEVGEGGAGGPALPLLPQPRNQAGGDEPGGTHQEVPGTPLPPPGAAVLLDLETFEILALASKPNYDLSSLTPYISQAASVMSYSNCLFFVSSATMPALPSLATVM